MERWRTGTRLPMILAALMRSEADQAVRRVAEVFGGDPVMVRDRLVGEPARRSRWLLFDSGGEIILHDDAVAAVILRLVPNGTSQRGLTLSQWIDGVDNNATLDDLKDAMGAPRHFAGFGMPFFTVDGGYVSADFANKRGWNDPGNLVSITVTATQPGFAPRPEDDACPICSDLLIRTSTPQEGVDVAETVASLSAARNADLLTEDASWVRLADLQPLHASGLMERVESQLRCTACMRIVCFTLFRDGSPTFDYYTRDEAMRRPLPVIPPVESWGDPSRISASRDEMQYVDHEPGAWFLVQRQDAFYLQARYSYSAVIDDSALIRLDATELDGYRAGGHLYLSDLARQIHNSAPYSEQSPYFERNLYRAQGGAQLRDAVAGAIVNHTWLAQQRQRQ